MILNSQKTHLFLICLLGLLFWSTAYYRIKSYPRLRENYQIDANMRFFGTQLGRNFYDFHWLDYQRFLLQKYPFILLFCDQSPSCKKQEIELQTFMKNSEKDYLVVLRVGEQTESEKNLRAFYNVTQNNTFISIDNDSNSVRFTTEPMDQSKLNELFSSVWTYFPLYKNISNQ